MNLKQRFILFFSSFVALLLVIFSVVVYRVADASRRDVATGRSLFFLRSFQGIRPDSLPHDSVPAPAYAVVNPKTTVIDSRGMIVYAYPAADRYVPDDRILRLIREKKQYGWEGEDGNEYTGIIDPATGNAVLWGSYDRRGLAHLSVLRVVLVVLVSGGTLLAVIASLFFTRLLFSPFRKMALQMREVYLRHTSDKIPQGRPEAETDGILLSFNGLVDRVNQLADFQKTFVFHASHEFRTPLATMLSETESALANELTPEGYRNVLLSLKEEQQDLIELTSSLLLLSLSDSNDFSKGWNLLRIDEVLYETISKASKFFPKLEVDMHFASVPDNPDDFMVRGEESLLRSAFLNILKNGYMYGIDQKVTVLIEFVADTIMVHFDNRGTQLPVDEKLNIMEPFFRGGNALKTKGYGLGLSVVNRIVMVMKGRFQYSAVGNDINRFTITLKKGTEQT